jgi:hypothetical protein
MIFDRLVVIKIGNVLNLQLIYWLGLFKEIPCGVKGGRFISQLMWLSV